MWVTFVRLSLLPSSRNQKKRKYFFQKWGVFWILFVSFLYKTKMISLAQGN